VTGGGSRSEIWAQTFADSFGLPVITTEARESGALGAVICAGIGAGVYASLEDAVEQTVRTVRVYEPNAARQAMLNETYQVFTQIVDALKTVWDDVEQRASKG
jgi:sugar (pentulose or hexulose) kinase